MILFVEQAGFVDRFAVKQCGKGADRACPAQAARRAAAGDCADNNAVPCYGNTRDRAVGRNHAV